MVDQLKEKGAADSAALWLDMLPEGLVLGGDAARFGHPLRVDFAEGKNAHRRRFGGGRGQLIARACGLKQGRTPSIIDATAGLGRDAFVLASLGCTVLMVERVAAIAAVLDDGLQRARAHPEVAEIASRLSLRWADSVSALGQVVDETGVPPQVVHLDPMFPHREKSALVKKDMRLFQALAGADEDASQLLHAALEVATHRVVVKRPRKAPSIEGPAPSHQVVGKTSRYDIYVHQSLS
ncbi:class I SAM-dependent methyltransferase [Larsenimonas rhizosphaerae]|uniref:class I SAM-dependent methyltransferase n=1 Tax=Larsenimonas rhizosphaerae TaxID=2944682 RepID=UPI00254667AE|nr:class I SAM-dependent methyltransferase [Larsenimonas rhizosphaerae]